MLLIHIYICGHTKNFLGFSVGLFDFLLKIKETMGGVYHLVVIYYLALYISSPETLILDLQSVDIARLYKMIIIYSR